MLFDVMDDQHRGSKCDALSGYSDLAVTPASFSPSRPRTVRINKLAHAGHKCFNDIFWLDAELANMSSSIKLHRVGGQQLHLFDQMAGNRPFGERMNAIQPAHMNDAWEDAVSKPIRGKVGEICHSPESTD